MKNRAKEGILTCLATGEARLLVETLLGGRYHVVHETSRRPIIESLREHEPSLVLVDMELPDVSGLEIVCRIRKDPLYSDLVIIGLGMKEESGAHKVAIVAGCTGFLHYPLDPGTFPRRIKSYLEGEQEDLELKDHLEYYRLFSEMLIEKLEHRLEVLEKKTHALESQRERHRNLTVQVLTSLAKLIEAKDPYTRGHAARVTRYAMALGDKVGIQGEDRRILERASLLHDLGKIAIDLSQIHKPGPLSEEERRIVDGHPQTAYDILSTIDFLQDEALIIRYHHLRFEDYETVRDIPRRIRTFASIITIADSFDAMTSKRSYNKPRSLEDAKDELMVCAGTQFDPYLVKAFLETPMVSEIFARHRKTGEDEETPPAEQSTACP